MSAAGRVAVAGLTRAPARTLVRVLVLAVAVALLGAMLLFVGHSLRTMTSSATRSVPLDLQGPVGSYSQARKVAVGVGRQPGILQASPTATAPFAGVTRSGPSGSTSAGAGAVLAVPPGYGSHVHVYRFLYGSLRPGGIVLDQQLAATLQAHVGDVVQVRATSRAPPRALRVTGVALITAPDVVFQPLNPQVGPAPAQPPADAAIMPLDTFQRTLGRDLRSVTPVTVGSSAVPGALDGVQWQVHAQVDPRGLGDTPAQAFQRASGIANRLERVLPGQVQFVNNLSDQLNTAAGDALYAETLYIMLAVPGALIALGVAYLAALGTVERDRRDLALLRARGADRRGLLGFATVESLALGLVAGLIGWGVALGATDLIVRGGVGLTPGRAAIAAGACIGLAVA
nr:hypothetical protein [Actinomycetota bacterium]